MDPNKAAISKSLLTRSKEPFPIFLTSIFILHLFIIFQIVADNETRPASIPLAASYLLFSSASNDSKLMTIGTLHDDVGLLVSEEALYLEVADEVFVLSQFVGYVAEMLDGHFFTSANDDEVGLCSE